MAVRFTSTFYSTHNGIKYKVDLLDENYVGSATSITLEGEGFDLEYLQSSDERFTPIKGSSVKLYLSITDDSAGSSLANWINSSVNATKEDQYFLRIYKNDSFYWFGVILSDLGTSQDASRPYQYILSATDGLARLKDFDFPLGKPENIPSPPNQYNFIELLFSVLELTPMAGYSGENLLFSTAVNWYDVKMPEPSSITDPLLYSRVSQKTFTQIGDNDELEAMSAWDVLESICYSWGMRVMLSEGLFRFYQVNIYREDLTTKWERYYRLDDGSFDGAAEWTYYPLTVDNDTFPHVTAGNQFQWFAPVKFVKLKQRFINTNLLDVEPPLTYNAGPPETLTYLKDLPDNIVGGSQRVLQLQFGLNMSGMSFFGYEIFFQIKIKLGNRYLYKPFGSTTMSWTTNSADRYTASFIQPAGTSNFNYIIQFDTPEIPSGTFNTNEFEFQIYAIREFFTNTFISLSTFNFSTIKTKAVLQFKQSSSVANDAYYLWVGSNTATPINSYDIELPDTLIGLFPYSTIDGQIFVYDGDSWELSSTWSLNNEEETGIDFNLLRVKEVLVGQAKACPRYQGSFIGEVEALNSIDYDDKRWILNGGTISAQSEQFNGDWYAVDLDYASFDDITDYSEETDGGGTYELTRLIGDVSTKLDEAYNLTLKNAGYVVTLSSNTTLNNISSVVLVNAVVTITLPDPADAMFLGSSAEITIKNICSGSGDEVTIDTVSGTIDGETSVNLKQLHTIVFVTNGTNYFIKSVYKHV